MHLMKNPEVPGDVVFDFAHSGGKVTLTATDASGSKTQLEMTPGAALRIAEQLEAHAYAAETRR